MLANRNIILSVLVLVSANLFAQSPTFEWAKGMGGIDLDHGWSVCVDPSSNVFSTGSFRDTVDFDPGNDTFQFIAQGTSDSFVQKLDSAGNLIWAKSMGGSGHCAGTAIVADELGNVYISGTFTGSVDFDPNSGTQVLTSNGLHDIFILKLDASGDLIWALSIGAEKEDTPWSITLDDTGHIYTTGRFTRTVDFDPGVESDMLTSHGYWTPDVFILKLDTDGNYAWAKGMGSSNTDMGVGIAVDSIGSVYTHGNFMGTVDFDPGTDEYNLTALIGPTGSSDMFIQKLDVDGNFLWAKQFGGTTLELAYSLALDPMGNVYTTGVFSDTVDFDPNPGIHYITSIGVNDTYIQKLDANGNFLWAKNIGGAYSNCGGYAITTDKYGSVYTSGFFNETVDFDPDSGTYNLTSAIGAFSNNDIFIQKLNAQGDFIWAVNMGDTLHDYGKSIQVDEIGNVYSVGTFQGEPDFDPNDGTSILIGNGNYDVYVQKLSQCFPKNMFSNDDISICANQPLTLEPQLPNATFLWQDNSTDPVFEPTQSGTYWVSATTDNCIYNDTVSVSFNPLPILNLGNDTSLCPGDVFVLDAFTPGATYSWHDDSNSSEYLVTTDGIYWLEITVDNCSSVDSSIVLIKEECEVILQLPNVITPNNDGINDLFMPTKSKGISSMNTIIYNRWGNKIFETQNLMINWDGQNVTAGSYYWVIHYDDTNGEQNSLKGHLLVLE